MNKKNTLNSIKKVDEIDTDLTNLTSTVNTLETKHDTFETSITDRADNIDKALRYLVGVREGDGTYIPIEFDGTLILGSLVQNNNGYDFINDLDEVLPNDGEGMTRLEHIETILSLAVTLSFVEEEVIPEILTMLGQLYALESGADHDTWKLTFHQASTAVFEDINLTYVYVSFNRTEKKLFVQVQMIQTNSVLLDFELKANYETGETEYVNTLTPQAVLFLNTENEFEYTPEGDYQPATKKYVDDACANASGNASGVDPVVYYAGVVVEPAEANGELDAQETSTLTIANEGKLNRKVNLGIANATDIQLNFEYTTPTNAPTITSNDMIEVNVEAFLYINDSLSSVTIGYNFYEDGTQMGDNAYLFQDGTRPTFEAGHQYQIFISYYITRNSTVSFATIGVIDFGMLITEE